MRSIPQKKPVPQLRETGYHETNDKDKKRYILTSRLACFFGSQAIHPGTLWLCAPPFLRGYLFRKQLTAYNNIS